MQWEFNGYFRLVILLGINKHTDVAVVAYGGYLNTEPSVNKYHTQYESQEETGYADIEDR